MDDLTYIEAACEGLSSNSLRDTLVNAGFEIKITQDMVRRLVKAITLFEIRGQHVEALNSAFVGVYPIHFIPSDADSIFDAFDIDKNYFTEVIKSYKGIPREFKVASDPFNLLIIWLVHLVIKSKLTESAKKEARINLFKILHYKFYTSVVNHNFPHGATPEVMQYVIDSLNAKFDIKNPDTPTWKLVMEKKSDELTSRSSIHYRTLETFVPDTKVIYVITDTQTRIRSTLVNTVIQPYYKAKELNNRIGNYSMVVDNTSDNTSFIRDVTALYDSMIVGVSLQVLNLNKLINSEYIKIVVAMSSNISDSMVRQMLIAFSVIATQQNSKGKENAIIGEGRDAIIIGYKALVSNIIQKSYRDCIINKVNVGSPIHVFEHVKNIYRSSRMIDPDILLIKRSVDKFVDEAKVTSRESTQASLKIAFILYIITMTFDYMK